MSVRRTRRDPAAFSLVEVTLAVAILSFSLVAILGLLSVGINAARDSGDDTKVGFIMQDVANRVRGEMAGTVQTVDPTKLDLTWNAAFGTSLNYTILGNTTLPPDQTTGKPAITATAYYTADGVLVPRAGAANPTPTPTPAASATPTFTPTPTFYKAEIVIQHLNPYPYPIPTPTPDPNPNSPISYPYLVVTVKIGWPTDGTTNGNVLGASSTAKAVSTFYLLKP